MKNKRKIIGVDEAGRGPLAGPVFAAAVFAKKKPVFFEEVKDSKKISEKRREKLFDKMISCKELVVKIGQASPKRIDEINILEATKEAMKIAINQIEEKGLVVVDGNFSVPIKRKQKSVIRADEKIWECSAASVVAKVSRDRVMRKMAATYPEYGFDRHKGYPTKKHKRAIKKFGSTEIHRKSFKLS